jgi:uncharacterized membrane protein (DUF485 family)
MSSQTGSEEAGPPCPDFVRIQESDQFQKLRTKHRRFVFPLAGAFLAWYCLYMLMAAYAHDFMSIRAFGNITIGLLFGLSQFVTTFAITLAYVAYANRVIDPLAEGLRDEIERGQAGAVSGSAEVTEVSARSNGGEQ